jgi:hypothetical protein
VAQVHRTVLDLMALVFLVALGFGAARLFRDEHVEDDNSAFGVYLAVLTGATFGARSNRPRSGTG